MSQNTKTEGEFDRGLFKINPSSYVCLGSLCAQCACFPTSDWLFFCWCHYLPIQGCLSLAALSYRPHPSGWQRQVPHGFRRGHVPYLVFPATKNHGQLVTSDTTILTRGSKGAQVCLFLLYEPGTICNEDNSFTEDVCRGKTRWFLTPRFCGNQMTSKERTLYHHFIPQAGWGAKIAA